MSPPDQLAALLAGLGPVWLAHLLLVFLRVGILVFIIPIFGDTTVPSRVRLYIALGMSVMIGGMVPPSAVEGGDPAGLIEACAGELVIGMLLGFVVRSAFWALQIGGTLAAQAISLSQILGTQMEQPQPAMAHVLYVGALALAAAGGFPAMVMQAVLDSYSMFPIGVPLSPDVMMTMVTDSMVRLFNLGFAIAGPFLVVAVLYNVCLGIVNKAMPQLMVAFVGAPAITWIGLAMLFLGAPLILQHWSFEYLRDPVFGGLR